MGRGFGAEAYPNGEVTIVMSVPLEPVPEFARVSSGVLRLVLDREGVPDQCGIELVKLAVTP